MKRGMANFACRLLVFGACLLLLEFGERHVDAAVISLEEGSFVPLTFDAIPATQYDFADGVLTCRVASSASFLLLPLARWQRVKGLRFLWRFAGTWKVNSPELEQSKAGDDAKFRLGLVVRGDSHPLLPFFAPAWVKLVAEHLKFPAEKMIYLVAGAAAPPGTRWQSPYSAQVEEIAIPSTPAEDGWWRASYRLSTPIEVVGLLLGADGDNSGSSFVSEIKQLVIDED